MKKPQVKYYRVSATPNAKNLGFRAGKIHMRVGTHKTYLCGLIWSTYHDAAVHLAVIDSEHVCQKCNEQDRRVMMNDKIYALESENLTSLGGPMGTERVTTNWIKYFSSVLAAKAYAEKDYCRESGTPRPKIQWFKEGRDEFRSDDLLFVMYRIKPIKIEE
jgi:hypothetical protein